MQYRQPPTLPQLNARVAGLPAKGVRISDTVTPTGLNSVSSANVGGNAPPAAYFGGKPHASSSSNFALGFTQFRAPNNRQTDAKRAASKLYMMRTSSRHKHRRSSQPDPREAKAAVRISKRSGFHAYEGASHGSRRHTAKNRNSAAVALESENQRVGATSLLVGSTQRFLDQ